ncbi:MAG: extracellular solute-binding protein [Acidimicrobiales bacterium]
MRHRIIAPALVSLLLVMAACGDDGGTGGENSAGAGAGSDTVTIYSGRTENLIDPILDDFTAETGIEVEVRYGQSADLALLIEEEAAAGQVRADVFLSQSPGSIGLLEASGRLAPLPDDVLALVPENVRDSDGRWIGFSGRQRVMVYHPELVAETELPASVFDLTDPAWKGRVGIAPSNGSFQDFVTTMRATEGDEATAQWLEAMVANDVVSYANNNAIVAAVARGEIDAGLVNHYYNHQFLAEDPSHPARNHQLASDDPGATLITTGAAIPDGAANPGGAAELITFLLGERGQRYFADQTFEYPLATGMAPSGEVPPIDFADADIDVAALGGGLTATRDLIIGAGLEG